MFLSACAYQKESQEGPVQPTDFPEDFYLQALTDIQNTVYRVDSKLSQILVWVQRGGIMALLGHEHIVASQNIQGYILINKTTGQCRADFFLPLSKLNVDDLQLRVEKKLNTTPSASDIINTKKNMLKSIEATNFPFAQLHSQDCFEALSGKTINVVLTIHGVSQDRQLTITMQQTQDEQLIINGQFSILQTEFGIEPFSIFNGLIEVEDKLDLTYKLIFTEIRAN